MPYDNNEDLQFVNEYEAEQDAINNFSVESSVLDRFPQMKPDILMQTHAKLQKEMPDADPETVTDAMELPYWEQPDVARGSYKEQGDIDTYEKAIKLAKSKGVQGGRGVIALITQGLLTASAGGSVQDVNKIFDKDEERRQKTVDREIALVKDAETKRIRDKREARSDEAYTEAQASKDPNSAVSVAFREMVGKSLPGVADSIQNMSKTDILQTMPWLNKMKSTKQKSTLATIMIDGKPMTVAVNGAGKIINVVGEAQPKGKGTTFNVGAGEKEWDKKQSAADVDEVTAGRKDLKDISAKLMMMNNIGAILKTGVTTGQFDKLILPIKKYYAATGLMTKDQLKEMSNEMIIKQYTDTMSYSARSDYMPGALSNQEGTKLEGMFLTLGMDTKALKFKLELMADYERQKKVMITAKTKYNRKNKGLAGWDDYAVNEFDATNAKFFKEQQRKIEEFNAKTGVESSTAELDNLVNKYAD